LSLILLALAQRDVLLLLAVESALLFQFSLAIVRRRAVHQLTIHDDPRSDF
jgi:hypothetical protein